MNKIFISHSRTDKVLHDSLRDALLELGYEVIGFDSLDAGSNLSKELNRLLHSADAVVAILTNESLHSKFVQNEMTVAMAQMDAVGNKLFIPIIVGENIEIPEVLLDRFVEMTPNFIDTNLNKVVSSINRALEKHKAAQQEKNRIRHEQAEKLEISKTEFIREAEERLTAKEALLKKYANIWYALGYVALLIGVVAAFFLIKNTLTPGLELTAILLLTVKGIIGVGLLVASSKYAFTLGKSYMDESLKNSDRLHAISFGKFYLQAYGNIASPEDVKEVFQHWNMSSDSSFREIGSHSFDPKLLESAIEIAKVMTKTSSKAKT